MDSYKLFLLTKFFFSDVENEVKTVSGFLQKYIIEILFVIKLMIFNLNIDLQIQTDVVMAGYNFVRSFSANIASNL